MSKIAHVSAATAVLAWLGLAAGCNSPRQADPAAARDALRAAFEAWKGGRSPDACLKESSLFVIDGRWEGGCKLIEYEIADGGEPQGYDMTFRVNLRLKDPKGRAIQETATYRVATSPKKVVVRGDEF
ncbi:MAG TPA: hypothetical protein VFW33_17925 [Gemmataceae bacterium]|nr:hypothetical protein [Gemmataceae bacterium]